MLQSFSINGYKQFENLKLDSLANINFIVGNNNVGKTTILEALYTWTCGLNLNFSFPWTVKRHTFLGNPYSLAEGIFSLAKKRDKKLEFSFSGMDNNQEVTFSHQININSLYLGDENIGEKLNNLQGRNFTSSINANKIIVAKWNINYTDSLFANYEISIPEFLNQDISPYKFAGFMDLLAHRVIQQININYSQIKRKGLLDDVLKRLKEVFPEVESIDMIPYPDGTPAPISVKTFGNDYLPIYSFGDGFQKWFYIISTTVLYKDAIMCIDEIDATLPPSAQADFCKTLIQYADTYNVQIFAATHNIEFIDRFLAEFNEYKNKHKHYNSRIITLKKIDSDIRVRNMSAEETLQLRDDFGLELR